MKIGRIDVAPRRPALVVALFLLLLPAAAARASSGEVTAVNGQVFIQAPGKEAEAAVVGATLKAGALVRTGSDGTAELQLGEGRLLKLSPNSRLRLSRHQRSETKRRVLLFFGRLWNRISSAGDGLRNFEVVTHNATAGVRGTDFETWSGNDGAVKVRVNQGDVDVGTDGGTAAVSSAEETNVGGAAAGPPEVTGHNDDEWEGWQAGHDDTLRSGGAAVSAALVDGARDNRDALARLTEEHERLSAERDAALASGTADDARLQQLNNQLGDLADDIGELADRVDAQAGLAARMSELASDPDFGMTGADAVIANAEEVERLRDETGGMADDRLGATDTAVDTPSAEEEGGVESLSRKGDSLVQRIEDIVRKIDDLKRQADADKDQVRSSCVAAILTNARSLKGIAEAANSDLEGAAARRDTQAVDDAYSRLSIAQQKCEQLLAEAQSCAGELESYAGETDVEMEVEEEAEGEEPDVQDTGSATPTDTPPPVASPFQ